MAERNVDNKKLLPIAIMAHNEEKVIRKAVESALNQRSPVDHKVKVAVVANGCDDRTENIVLCLEREYPNRVKLIPIQEKGKTVAINKAIKYFDGVTNSGTQIPYVIFLDADCEFYGTEVLVNFAKRFEQDPQLCAVAADYLPDVFFNSRTDIVAEIYRAIYNLRKTLRINSISGMCYGIRLDVLKKIDFPELHFNEDMFVSARLDGWFIKDKNMKIVFKTPSDLPSEIIRRTRQEISSQRYHGYYSYLKNKGERVKLFDKSLGRAYRWGGDSEVDIFKECFGLKGIKLKFFVAAYLVLRLVAKIGAYRKIRQMKKTDDIDFWKVLR